MLQFRVRSLAETTSTNDEVKRALAAGEPEGLAVRALRQTAGYGRQGRAWESPVGGMYQSFLLRPAVPPAQLPTLSLAVGLAVRRAVASLVPAAADTVLVKWPNDVVVGDRAAAPDVPVRAAFRKLCGISVEACSGGICVGVGVNVANASARGIAGAGSGRGEVAALSDVPARIGENVPVHLDELGFCTGSVEHRIAAVADAVCAELASLYDAWCRDGFAPLLPEYDARAALAGRAVTIVDHYTGDELCSGTVLGADEHGRLLLRDAAGVVHPIMSGEAHIA